VLSNAPTCLGLSRRKRCSSIVPVHSDTRAKSGVGFSVAGIEDRHTKPVHVRRRIDCLFAQGADDRRAGGPGKRPLAPVRSLYVMADALDIDGNLVGERRVPRKFVVNEPVDIFGLAAVRVAAKRPFDGMRVTSRSSRDRLRSERRCRRRGGASFQRRRRRRQRRTSSCRSRYTSRRSSERGHNPEELRRTDCRQASPPTNTHSPGIKPQRRTGRSPPT
jgi:hypothetical protein